MKTGCDPIHLRSHYIFSLMSLMMKVFDILMCDSSNI